MLSPAPPFFRRSKAMSKACKYDTIPCMSYQKRYRILVEAYESTKAIRDRCSGFMNYVMTHKLPWDIRFITFRELQELQTLKKLVRKWRPDGVCLNTGEGNQGTFIHGIRNIVAFGSPDAKLPERTVFVNINDMQISSEAFKLLLRRGLTNFAYIHNMDPIADASHSKTRAESFIDMAREAGFSCIECHNKDSSEDWTVSLVSIAEKLKKLPLPCGIMAFNDSSSRTIIDACNYARLRIPEQIQIVSVDNETEVCENIFPRLTSVDPDFFTVGYVAAQRMEELLASGRSDCQTNTLCGVPRIVERDTTRDLSNSARLATAAEKLIRLHACRGLPPSPKGLTLKSLAAALNVSRSLLELRFSTVHGEGVAAAIRREKLKEVCRQLKDTDLPIGDIAYRCGFPAQTHLNALFRRTFGCSLREYRSSHKNHSAT